jgi:hypothetical protein
VAPVLSIASECGGAFRLRVCAGRAMSNLSDGIENASNLSRDRQYRENQAVAA